MYKKIINKAVENLRNYYCLIKDKFMVKSIPVKAGENLRNYYFSIKDKFMVNSIPVKLYILGIAIYGIGFFSTIIVIKISPEWAGIYFSSYNMLSVLLWAVGFCWESITWLNKLLKNSIMGNLLLGVPSSALVTTVSIALSAQMVNNTLKIEPINFTYSVNIIAVLLAPVVLSFLIAVILFLYWLVGVALMVLLTPTLPFAIFDNLRKFLSGLFIFRLSLAMIFAFSILALNSYFFTNFKVEISNSIKVVVALVDYYEFGVCDKSDPKMRYRLLSNNKVSAVTVGSGLNDLTFSYVECKK